MKILISPAKSLDFESPIPNLQTTVPIFKKPTQSVNEILKKYNPRELADLMHISDKLANLNWTRNQERQLTTKGSTEKVRPAVYAFNGDVYSGLDVYSLEEEKIGVLQNKLRILSGLYGLLKPLDVIEPYRLEMGTKMAVEQAISLHEFWKPWVTSVLNKEMKKGELLVNLASKEYFSAIDKKSLISTLITPDFKELRDGKLKSISFFAKKARGMMVRYIIDNEVETVEGLKGFNLEGYAYSETESTENKLLFVR